MPLGKTCLSDSEDCPATDQDWEEFMKIGCLVGVGVSALGLIIPAASAAACEVSLTGHFVIDQTGTPNLEWDLVQDRNGAVTGSVIFSGGTGTVSGSVSHNNRGADLVVTWRAGGVGAILGRLIRMGAW